MPDAAIDIPNLEYRYANAIDAADFEAAADLFRNAHLVAEGAKIEGAENMIAMWQSFIQLYGDGTPRTRHIITNPIIEIGKDQQTARCEARWTVLQATERLPLQPVATGRYLDEFAIINGAWRFTKKEYAGVDLAGDMSGHLKQQWAEEG